MINPLTPILAQSLKRAHSKGQLNFELGQFAETFKNAQ